MKMPVIEASDGTVVAENFVYIVLRNATLIFFFFQAEDGIRDIGVTGFQTCALPILTPASRSARRPVSRRPARLPSTASADLAVPAGCAKAPEHCSGAFVVPGWRMPCGRVVQ